MAARSSRGSAGVTSSSQKRLSGSKRRASSRPCCRSKWLCTSMSRSRLGPITRRNGGGAIQAKLHEVLDAGGILKSLGHAIEGGQFHGVETRPDGFFGHGSEARGGAVIGGAIDVGVIADAGAEGSADR